MKKYGFVSHQLLMNNVYIYGYERGTTDTPYPGLKERVASISLNIL